MGGNKRSFGSRTAVLSNDINKLASGFAEELVGDFHKVFIRFQSPQVSGLLSQFSSL